ncbi:ATP-binding protein [Kineococcus aurantiacus]|uniref:histidine kinase n=1 Tax=Kineococcus aurantiacus TaxID=37633 RepID=A0A7Y9DKD2_9ACTN|nr:sensor histidine kinase regulating citrate/malate metabolism [Kineococcus aurantiacus]
MVTSAPRWPASGRFVHRTGRRAGRRAGRRPGRRTGQRHWTLASRVLVLQLLVVLLVVVGATAALGWQLRTDTRRDATVEVTDVAAAVAQAPDVRDGLADPATADRAAIAAHVEAVRRATGVYFITVMDRDRIRWTHPDPSRIGGRFVGHADAALAGGRVVETYTGTLGPSVRAVLPIRARVDGRDGVVVGAVAVGVATRSVTADLLDRLPVLLLALALALALSVVGSWALSRWVRRRTHGLEPADLTRLWEVNDAVLHSLREGLVVVDPAGRQQVVNDEARRLLPSRDDGTLDVPPALQRLLGSGEDVVDDVQVTDDRVLVVSRQDARWEGRRVGTVVTLRDHTELQALTRDLDAVRGLADALRSQAHEAANRLHVVVTLVEQGQPERAVEFATAELAAAQQLTDLVVADVADPAVAALLVGKSAQAAERGVELEVEPDTALADGLLPARDLVTVVGNLVDNGVEAALAHEEPRWVRVRITAADGVVQVRVTDSGEGLRAAELDRAMQRGWSRKEHRLSPEGAHGLGLALVGQVVRRHGGRVRVEEPVTVDDGGGTLVVDLPVAP